jgi:hypothetical protein
MFNAGEIELLPSYTMSIQRWWLVVQATAAAMSQPQA